MIKSACGCLLNEIPHQNAPLLTTMVCLICFFCMTGRVSETRVHSDMNVFYSDSTTDLKQWCDHCIKFQPFEGAQRVFSRVIAVCCMSIPHNPYKLPQHYKRHVCGLSCSCPTSIFVNISSFRALVSSELYAYSTPLTTFLINNQSSFHRPVLIFQPQCKLWTKLSVSKQLSQLGQNVQLTCWLINQVFWRGHILASQRKRDLQGSCSIGALHIIG